MLGNNLSHKIFFPLNTSTCRV